MSENKKADYEELANKMHGRKESEIPEYDPYWAFRNDIAGKESRGEYNDAIEVNEEILTNDSNDGKNAIEKALADLKK